MARKDPGGRWPNIEELITSDGDITIGRVGPVSCAATAADGHNALAMLVRRPRESFEDLLTRLDEAIHRAFVDNEYTDEINA